jgi:hypothetical protein
LGSTAQRLRQCYENVSESDRLFPVKSWEEVGASVAEIYKNCFKGST